MKQSAQTRGPRGNVAYCVRESTQCQNAYCPACGNPLRAAGAFSVCLVATCRHRLCIRCSAKRAPALYALIRRHAQLPNPPIRGITDVLARRRSEMPAKDIEELHGAELFGEAAKTAV